MNEHAEVEEANEVREVKEKRERRGEVAAFFDLDGTLLALPSLEGRLFRTLRYQRAIPAKNYFLWLKESVRLIPRGISAIAQANKMYLRGVRTFDKRGGRDGDASSLHEGGHEAEGQASARYSKRARRNPRSPFPAFFPEAIERVAWHAKQQHEIALVSGTLEPLAREAASALETELSARGIIVAIRVCATRLEEMDGMWTGRVLGEAMFGEAKARAAKRLAAEMRLDLACCYAYGDTANDRWLLGVVGKAAAVNPSKEFARIARTHGWAVLHWEKKEGLTQRHRRHGEVVTRKEQPKVIA